MAKDSIISYTPTKAIIKLSRLNEAMDEKEVTLMESLLKKIAKYQKGVQ